jgi:hypothetical protein
MFADYLLFACFFCSDHDWATGVFQNDFNKPRKSIPSGPFRVRLKLDWVAGNPIHQKGECPHATDN